MARASSELERLRAITHSLQTMSSVAAAHGPVLPTVLPELKSLLGADVSCAYAVRIEGDRCHPEYVYGEGLPDSDSSSLAMGWFEQAPIPWGLFDPSRPDPEQRNRVRMTEELKAPPEAPPPIIVRELYPKLGLANKDQLRVLLCEDRSLLAWVGAFRSEPFTAHERVLLERLVEPLRTRLALERRLRLASVQERALEVTLNSLGAAAFILGPRGAVLEANAAGEALLEKETGLRQTLRDAVAGEPTEFSLTLLRSPGVPDHHLAIQRVMRGAGQLRASAAAVRWKLTRRQTDVLELLTLGMSNRAIAARLSCSESTVEIHVSAVLAKADAESRAELVARVWSQDA